MKNNLKLSVAIIALLSTGAASATSVKTCTLDYSGVMNAIDVDNGVVTGVAKLFAKESANETFTLVAKDGQEYERSGTITTTVDLSQFAADGESCSFDNRFTPIHSISDNRPWRQFQMRFDSYYDSNIMARYQHNGIDTKLMVANGWTWGADMAGIHVFEMINGEFFPVKYDIDQGNGELPAYKAGQTLMSLDGDGGQWQYRASAVSDDGRLVAGYAKLEQDVDFENGSEIKDSDKFGMIWELAESCSIDSSKCNDEDASRLTSGSDSTSSIQVRSLSARQINRDASEKAVYSNGENVTIDTSRLSEGQVISYGSIPTDFTIGYRFLTGAENVVCTLIDTEGAFAHNKLERYNPYVIFGDSNNGEDYNTRDKSVLGAGELTLKIAAYDNRNCEGEPFFNDSVTVSINKTDNTSSPGAPADEATEATSGEFYLVDRQEQPSNFEMLTFDADSTMASIFGINTISEGKYLLHGRSASGKAMVALVTL